MTPSFSFEGSFEDFETKAFVSKSISYADGNIARAKLTINEACLSAPTDNFTYYLTNNGGTNWEEAENATEHTFATTGNDLRYKIVGTSGAYVVVLQSSLSEFPINISFSK